MSEAEVANLPRQNRQLNSPCGRKLTYSFKKKRNEKKKKKNNNSKHLLPGFVCAVGGCWKMWMEKRSVHGSPGLAVWPNVLVSGRRLKRRSPPFQATREKWRQLQAAPTFFLRNCSQQVHRLTDCIFNHLIMYDVGAKWRCTSFPFPLLPRCAYNNTPKLKCWHLLSPLNWFNIYCLAWCYIVFTLQNKIKI